MAVPFYETPRDREICVFVYQYNGVSIELLTSRFWGQTASSKAAYNRVARLIDYGYLEGTRIPSLTGIGSGKYFLGLGPRGRGVVAERLGVTTGQLHRIRPPHSPLFYAHHLGVCRTRLTLETAIRHSSVFSLVEWIPERAYKDQPLGQVVDAGTKVNVIPDGGFVLSFGQSGTPGYLQFALEYDTGSENASAAIHEKLRHYLLLCRQPDQQHLIVLFVVPSQPRLVTLATAAIDEARLLGADAARFWLTTSTQLDASDAGAMDAVLWQSPGTSAPFSIAGFVLQAATDVPIAPQKETTNPIP